MQRTFDIESRRPWLLLGLQPLWFALAWWLWRFPAMALVLVLAGPVLTVLLFFRWRNSLTLNGDRLLIRAGPSALSVAFREIDPGSVRRIDDDQAAQERLERRAGATLGAFRYGWFGAVNDPMPRWFLASNGRHVLAFSMGNGTTEVRVSLINAGDCDQALAALRRAMSA